MGDLEIAAEVLADELERPDRSGIIMLLSEGCESSVYSTPIDTRLLATVAQAMDQNPRLIKLFLDAAWMVSQHGNSKDDPAFRSVRFYPGGVQ